LERKLNKSSEKARIPAWCDRVLWKGENLRQTNYNTAPLRFSDHRPVYATFQCRIKVEDTLKKESLAREIYETRRAEFQNGLVGNVTSEPDDDETLSYDPVAPGLPPASSERQKWWINDGMNQFTLLMKTKLTNLGVPVRSNIAEQRSGFIPNPNRPSNPFTSTTEPDWLPKTQNLPQKVKEQPTRDLITIPTDSTLDQSTTQYRQHRTLSNASTTSTSIQRKPAPPIPKKPNAFSSSPSSTTPTTTISNPPLPRRPTMPVTKNIIDTGFPPPPRRATETVTRSMSTLQSKLNSASANAPQLPARPGQNGSLVDISETSNSISTPSMASSRSNHPASSSTSGGSGVLMDMENDEGQENEEGKSKFPVLMPVRLGSSMK
jgi:hypothetical protein